MPMNEEQVRFCLRCGAALQPRQVDRRMRPSCPSCGWTYFDNARVAAAALLTEGQRVLLVQRRFPPFAGLWGLPAGFVDGGEDPAQTAARECAEETGLQVRPLRLVETLTGRIHPRGADVVLVYQAALVGGQLQAADDAGAADWFPLAALPPLAFPSTQRVLEKLAHGRFDLCSW